MNESTSVAALQAAALIDFEQRGLPTRRDEAWKYTSTVALAKHQFTRSAPVLLSSTWPEGVIVSSWAQALPMYADYILPYLDKLVDRSHGFQAQNTAMLRDGVFIYIPEGVHLDSPLMLTPPAMTHAEARYLRYLIVTAADSAVSIIEDYTGLDNTPYFTNTLTELLVGPRARVQHYKLQREGLAAYHVGHLAARLLADSHLDCHSISLGGQWVRSDTQIEFAEPGAQCRLNGIYLTSGTQHVDHHTVVAHQVPNCASSQDYRGILSGRSRAVFNGSVVVAVDAQHSNAQQQNKNMLLSSQAEVDTKPQLEIFADDVQCSHGATVGQLSEDALFYLMSRGIRQDEARQLLLNAFVQANLQQLANREFADLVTTLIQQRAW
jgi:Fe-S cluster assembly protein SufD